MKTAVESFAGSLKPSGILNRTVCESSKSESRLGIQQFWRKNSDVDLVFLSIKSCQITEKNQIRGKLMYSEVP